VRVQQGMNAVGFVGHRSLIQYLSGCIHRSHVTKSSVKVYPYVDHPVPPGGEMVLSQNHPTASRHGFFITSEVTLNFASCIFPLIFETASNHIGAGRPGVGY